MYSVLTSKSRPKEENIAELERLLNRIGQIVTASGARLYWITPASAHPERFSAELQEEMRTILTRTASRYGRAFDSYAVTRFTDPYPGTDGIHYGPNEATAWSRLVARDVITYSGRVPGSRRAAAARAEAGRAGGSAKGRGFWDIFRRKRPARSAGDIAADADADNPPGLRSTDNPTPLGGAATSGAPPLPAEDPLEVEVTLKQKSASPNLAEVTYRSALGIFEYEVVAVNRGTYEPKTIRIAHLVVMNNQYTSINERPLGYAMTLQVERLSRYPNLEKIQTVDDLEAAYDLPVFVPKLSAAARPPQPLPAGQ